MDFGASRWQRGARPLVLGCRCCGHEVGRRGCPQAELALHSVIMLQDVLCVRVDPAREVVWTLRHGRYLGLELRERGAGLLRVRPIH